ncbi:arsenic resistance N-acetyltransferase ArsN2 [Stenotrophomonas lactitubi]|uniref:arsenic resistance N-acetyltransferase ArsN2 n=1 Tax=Stenotrophomonas lactitubi TaxID=2045214 RepID=UPI00320AB4FD
MLPLQVAGPERREGCRMRVMETALSAEVLALLEASGLPTEDLRAGRPITLLAATLDGELLGCVGYESSRDVVLLRSLAIRPMSQGRGLGRHLVVELERHARAAGGRTVFLLTTTAAPFFGQLGYECVARDAAPGFVAASTQFSGLCPGSAQLMMRRL